MGLSRCRRVAPSGMAAGPAGTLDDPSGSGQSLNFSYHSDAATHLRDDVSVSATISRAAIADYQRRGLAATPNSSAVHSHGLHTTHCTRRSPSMSIRALALDS
jgi:hypothetical protein